jgi:hypothetical protein
MATKETSPIFGTMKSNWAYFLLILLVIEKIIQHVFVTLAFYFNLADIASTVVVSPKILMILGAIIAVLFVFSLWGMIQKRRWAVNLVIALGFFDIIGEFVAQGKIGIVINVSFIIATVLLIVALLYRRQSYSRSIY